MVDGRRIGVLRIGNTRDGDIARGIELPIPVVPADSAIIRPWVVVSGLAALGRQQDKAWPVRIAAERVGFSQLEQAGLIHNCGRKKRWMEENQQGKLVLAVG